MVQPSAVAQRKLSSRHSPLWACSFPRTLAATTSHPGCAGPASNASCGVASVWSSGSSTFHSARFAGAGGGSGGGATAAGSAGGGGGVSVSSSR